MGTHPTNGQHGQYAMNLPVTGLCMPPEREGERERERERERETESERGREGERENGRE